MNESYYKYWGKAKKKDDGTYDYHLLPYHCLDVAAVGSVWLKLDEPLRDRFLYALGVERNYKFLENLLSLFLSFHDFGKFDIRFQSKVIEVRDLIRPDINKEDLALTNSNITEYDHGKSGYGIFVHYYDSLFDSHEDLDSIYDIWRPWIASVTGHHGIIPNNSSWTEPFVEQKIREHDRKARYEWFYFLINQFVPQAINKIPVINQETMSLLAGFCSVADWIASNEIFVCRVDKEMSLPEYFESTIDYCLEKEILQTMGICGKSVSKYVGISALLADGNKPRQVQTIIDKLILQNSLTIIEGTTGSGKTEAALALAWKLIDSGMADSIIFALPTQATSDAMLERLQILAPLIFGNNDVNLVLAHGKSNFNKVFANLKNANRPEAKKCDQGSVQCAQWISASRKRVFLGQIGVCTIDQILLSILPLRHNFVRSFGLMKSVLIVDEVHAYDRYMYGLLEEVLRYQKSVGSNVILLSATLPYVQKKELLDSWYKGSGDSVDSNAQYPLITTVNESGEVSAYTVEKEQLPPNRDVSIDLFFSQDAEPDDLLIQRIAKAAESGATIAVVCNVVQSAQRIARKLMKVTSSPVDIFHARYRFKDRQEKETIAKKLYGKNALREGRILVATQVIEQSLDLDFDWLITQLCPIDLLFQRLGRLHRHNRPRPEGFIKPRCTILTCDKDDFGIHELIYGDVRILWRTRELLINCQNVIHFPSAYREWIELVYGRDQWNGKDEPDSVIGKSCCFRQIQEQLWNDAKKIANSDINSFKDDDYIASSLTRGKEMGINIVPIQSNAKDRVLLDGERILDVNEYERDELLNLNAIPVSSQWKDWLPPFEDGYIYLPMEFSGETWIWKKGNNSLQYTKGYGLERLEDE